MEKIKSLFRHHTQRLKLALVVDTVVSPAYGRRPHDEVLETANGEILALVNLVPYVAKVSLELVPKVASLMPYEVAKVGLELVPNVVTPELVPLARSPTPALDSLAPPSCDRLERPFRPDTSSDEFPPPLIDLDNAPYSLNSPVAIPNLADTPHTPHTPTMETVLEALPLELPLPLPMLMHLPPPKVVAAPLRERASFYCPTEYVLCMKRVSARAPAKGFVRVQSTTDRDQAMALARTALDKLDYELLATLTELNINFHTGRMTDARGVFLGLVNDDVVVHANHRVKKKKLRLDWFAITPVVANASTRTSAANYTNDTADGFLTFSVDFGGSEVLMDHYSVVLDS